MKLNLNLKKQSRYYFYNLFLSIAVFSVCLIIVLSLSLYFNFRNYSLDVINKSNEKMLVQLSNSILQVDNQARTFTASLFKNADAVTLMCSENIDIYSSMHSRIAIDNLIKGIPYIHSVYLYNGRKESYTSMGPNPVDRSKSSFYDSEIVRILDQTSAKTYPAPLARRVPNTGMASGGTSDVYSYIITEFFAGTDKLKNAAVVNIKFDWVYNSLMSVNDHLSGNTRNNIVIIDKSGHVVGHSLDTLFLENLSGEKFVQQILSGTTASETGSIVSDYQSVRSVITYVYIKDLHWYMLSITPYDYIAASVVKVKTITILVCMLLMAIALFLAFLLSRQLYSPIRILGNKAAQMLGKELQPKDQANEFDRIEHLFSNTTNRLVSLENFRSTNLRQIKTEALRDFLLHKLDQKAIEEKIAELDITISQQSAIMLVLFRLDRYEQFCMQYSPTEQTLCKTALANMALEIFAREWKGEAADIGNDQVVFFLNTGSDLLPESTVAESLIHSIREIQELFEKNIHLSVSAFISPASWGIEQIHWLYNKVLLLSKYRVIYGHGCILTEKDMEKCQAGRFGISSTSVQHLIDSLKLGRADAISEHLDAIISSLYSCEYNVLMSTLSYLTSSIFNALTLIEKNSLLSFDVDFVSFSDRIARLDTLEEIKLEYLSLFQRAIDRMNQRKDQNNNSITANVVKYIDTNYRDRNLCTDMLADKFNLTPAYLGKLFRENMSTSISDYITDVRITRARDLLESDSQTVDEILDKLGWENKKYFFTIFKKNFGVTPTEYRLKYKTSKE